MFQESNYPTIFFNVSNIFLKYILPSVCQNCQVAMTLLVYLWQLDRSDFLKFLFICFWLCWVIIAVWTSLQLQPSGATLFVVLRFLIAVASFVAERELQNARALESFSFQVLEHRFSSWVHRLGYSEACGIFLDQDFNLCLLCWQADFLPLSHQGSASVMFVCLFFLRVWGQGVGLVQLNNTATFFSLLP